MPLNITSESDATINDYPINDFLPPNLCTNHNLKGLTCKKPNNITFRKITLNLDNNQKLSIEIPFKFTDLAFISILQTYKNDFRVLSVSYFGEIVRPHPINKICP